MTILASVLGLTLGAGIAALIGVLLVGKDACDRAFETQPWGLPAVLIVAFYTACALITGLLAWRASANWIKRLIGLKNTLDADRPIIEHRGPVLGLLAAALVLAEISKDVILSRDRGSWHPACSLFYYGTIICLPFVLARLAPKAAGFNTQWLPGSRWHWAWFAGMVLLLLVSRPPLAALATRIVGRPAPRWFMEPVTPMRIVFQGIVSVVVAPLAEEVFFRGYVLEQLRKLTRPGVALVVQSLLFGMFHLALALTNSVNALFLGLILGAWRIRFKSLIPLVLAHVLFNAALIPSLKAQYDWVVGASYAKRPTISRETTYITEPLRKDGYPDYVAVLNRQCSEGVTPENNSAVLFWKAVGPGSIYDQDRERYFRMLGVPPLPEKGDYFADLETYLAQPKGDAEADNAKAQPKAGVNAYDLVDPALKRPWSQEEFPVLAAWLAANEKPLALLAEASKRPRRYDPLVCGERTPLIAVSEPALDAFHRPGDILGALVARAMQRLGQSEADEAWEDLLTCHRFARLVGQGPTGIDAIHAGSLDQKACAAEQVFLTHAHLTSAQVTKMREDLDRLPTMPSVADTLDVRERFEYLDNVLTASREGRSALTGVEQAAAVTESLMAAGERGDADNLTNVVKMLRPYAAQMDIDWELVLRTGNAWFDRFVEASRQPTQMARRAALCKLYEDFRKLKAAAADAATLEESLSADPAQAFSERAVQVMLISYLPAIEAEIVMADRTTMTFELTKLAFALAAYRADHGSFPAALSDLVPQYIREVPQDIYNVAEPHYRQDGAGYLLYSVGPNRKDNGGRGFENGGRDEESAKKDWDDVVIRMPGSAKQ